MVRTAVMAHVHVRADSRDISEGGLKNIAAAVIEIPSGETHGVGTSFEGVRPRKIRSDFDRLRRQIEGIHQGLGGRRAAGLCIAIR